MASSPVLQAPPGDTLINALNSSASAKGWNDAGSVKKPTGSPMRASCQWFDMSPRQSIESPTQRPPRGLDLDEDEENAVPNVAKIKPAGKMEKGAMRSAKTTQPIAAQQSPTSTRPMAAQQSPPSTRSGTSPQSARVSLGRRPGTSPQSARVSLGRDQVLPCMRQHTPTRKGADGCSRAESPLASSARKSASVPPATPDGRSDFAEASVCNTSMYSEFSCSSRLSQLSRRSTTRKHLSTEELIHQQMEERKRIVAKQIQRNQVNCAKAKHPDPAYAHGRMKHSTRVTLPKEFKLSQTTPRRRESRNFDGEESVCSLKSVSSVKSISSVKSVDSVRKKQATSAEQAATLGSARKWKPSLTVPRGPTCIEEPRTRRSISEPRQDRDDVSEMSVGSVSSRKSLTRSATPEIVSSRKSLTRSEQQIPLRSATPEKRVTRAATPENRTSGTTQPTRAATPEGRKGQTTRVATPQRGSEPVREGTPQRRQPLQAVHEKRTAQPDKERAGRAELARKAAEEKSAAEQATRNSERHCIFKRPQQPTPTSPSTLEAGPSVQGSSKTLTRRPSFGSSASRF